MDGEGRVKLATGERLTCSGHEKEKHANLDRVAFMLSESPKDALMEKKKSHQNLSQQGLTQTALR